MYKWLIFFVFALNINILNAQNTFPERWAEYISTTKKATDLKENEPITCLLKLNHSQNYQHQQYKILRRLDKEYAIISLSVKDFKKFKVKQAAIWIASNNWKLNKNLTTVETYEMRNFLVKVNNSVEFKTALQKQSTLTIIDERGNTFIIRGTFGDIQSQLSKYPSVQYIGLESLVPVHEAKIPEMDLSVNNINLLHHNFKTLTGSEQIVSIKDNMFDLNDIDLADKFFNTSNQSSETDAHATAMATLVAGLGNSSIKGKGVAFDCSVASSDYNNLLPDLPKQLSGIYTQNHSYGTTIENFYGALAESYDDFCYSNPNILHIFSSGNTGEAIPTDGIYAGLGTYSNLSGNFKMAKNILCVGAIDQYNVVMPFSSKGPAFDGRIKPDVMAFSRTGTSNSTALISGLSVLLQQQYKKRYAGNAPSALIKACLINSAKDIATPGPDYATGFGSIDANNSLLAIDNDQFILNQITDSQTKTYTIDVPSNAAELKITLVWTDAPAPVNSNIALVNDLDLRLIAPDLSSYLPWILDPGVSLEKITAPAQRGIDHLNNIEQITVANPISGSYTIEIHGFDISSTNQSFAIAYEWKIKNNFQWTFPTGSDAIAIGESSLISLRWDNTYFTETGDLSVSYDKGVSWQLIDNQIDLSKNIYDWYPDNNINSTCLLKMKIAGTEHLTDTFVVAKETNIKVGLDCEDNIELNWNENTNASFYKIYNFLNNKMLPVAETTELSYVFKKSDYNSRLFAVEPVYDFEIPAQRSETIDYNAFGANCYFNSFYALGKNDESPQGVEIYLELGSSYQLNRLEIYRIIENEPSLITEINNPDKNDYIYLDTSPKQGRNLYQAKLILDDGTEYLSEIIDIIFLSEQAYLVFPNPASSLGLNVYTKNFQVEKVTFKLYDIRGKQLLSQQLSSDREHIDLQTVKNGTYIYRLESSDGIIESSVLIVQ